MYLYRLIPILLCLKAAAPAPQPKESDVTYVKIQPVVENNAPAASNIRESRIEKLPLTIPGNITQDDKLKTDQLATKAESSTKSEAETNNSGNTDESGSKSDEKNESDNLNSSDLNSDDLSGSNTENLADTVPLEAVQSDRQARNFDAIETTETSEDATEREDLLIDHTEVQVPITKAPHKFVSKGSKLSYYPKPKVYHSHANLLENGGKRKFRSNCRCEKIWNCPKLQISVPRCPNEYFLCCF